MSVPLTRPRSLSPHAVTSGAERALAVLLAGPALLPALWLLWLVVHNWVNTPFGDEWEMTVGGALTRFREGTLTGTDLLAQHNESRKLFPRLLILALNPAGPWDVRRQMALSLVFLAVIAWTLFRLLGRSGVVRLPGRVALMVPLGFLLFTPAQWENSLWGIQMIVFMPPLALALALAVHTSDRFGGLARGVLAAGLAFFATFSYANGMILWPLAFPWPGLAGEGGGRRGGAAGGRLIYVIAGAASLGLYFRDYHKGPGEPLTYCLQHPGEAAAYFCNWCAGPFVNHGQVARIVVGAALAGAFAALAVVAVRRVRWEGGPAWRAFYPWLTLGAYAVGSGVVTTLGRVGFGVDQASSSRYVSFSVYLPVAILALAVVLDRREAAVRAASFIPGPSGTRGTWLARAAAVVLLAGGAVLYGQMVEPSVTMFKELKRQRRAGREALTFLPLVPDHPDLVFAYPFPKYLGEKLPPYLRTGAVVLPPLPAALLPSLALPPPAAEDALDESRGDLNVCAPAPEADGRVLNLHVAGWARGTDLVVLTADAPGNAAAPARPFHVLRPGLLRPDVVRALGAGPEDRTLARCGFDALVSRANVPGGGQVRVMAWAVDPVAGGAARPLRPFHVVDLPPLPPPPAP